MPQLAVVAGVGMKNSNNYSSGLFLSLLPSSHPTQRQLLVVQSLSHLKECAICCCSNTVAVDEDMKLAYEPLIPSCLSSPFEDLLYVWLSGSWPKIWTFLNRKNSEVWRTWKDHVLSINIKKKSQPKKALKQPEPKYTHMCTHTL